MFVCTDDVMLLKQTFHNPFMVYFQMYKQKILFLLGDQLPMNYDAAISIFSVCRTPESEKMKHCITSYVNALIDIWTKAFGEGHVKDRENITKK